MGRTPWRALEYSSPTEPSGCRINTHTDFPIHVTSLTIQKLGRLSDKSRVAKQQKQTAEVL